MNTSPCNEIKTEYDADSCTYYVVWQPPVVIGAGQTEKEALEDMRDAVRFCIEEMVDLKIGTTG
jgi:predicted RNase H-like HicB family nuclease